MTLDDQIKSVGREIGLRRNVYPGFVRNKKLTQEKADHELAAMEAVYATLKALKWIPVEERLPDDDVSVMIAVGGETGEPVWIGWHDGDGWHDTSGAPCQVTAWKDLPAEPEQDAAPQVKPPADASAPAVTPPRPAVAALNPVAAWPFPQDRRP